MSVETKMALIEELKTEKARLEGVLAANPADAKAQSALDWVDRILAKYN